MPFSMNSRQLGFLAQTLTSEQWAALGDKLKAMALDDAEEGSTAQSATDPGSYGNENFAAEIYRNATVSSSMHYDAKFPNAKKK